MTWEDKLGPYSKNFDEFLLFAINIAGSGPELRFGHFKEALKQLNKPVMVSIQVIKQWGLDNESFSDRMQEEQIDTVSFLFQEDAGGTILFPNEETFKEFEEYLLEAQEGEKEVVKRVLN